MSNTAICHISVARNIKFNTDKALRKTLQIPKIADTVTFKGSGASGEVKIVFSDDPSQNMLRPTYEIK